MPRYDYQFTDEQGGTFEDVASIRSEPMTEYLGRPCRRVPSCPSVRTQYGEGSHTKPVEMLSIAVDNEEEVDAFRARNPGVEISRDRSSPLFGVPVAKSRSEKLRVLKQEGFVETN
jgi:hypothetical protein